MANIFQTIGAALKWLGKVFTSIEKDADKIAISITEQVKHIANGTIASTIASVLDTFLKSHVAEDVLAVIKATANKALAVELSLQGLPNNPTEAEVLAFEQQVFKAITGLDPYGKSKLWTVFSAQLYGILKPIIEGETAPTFAVLVADIEQAYQDFLADQAAENDTNN